MSTDAWQAGAGSGFAGGFASMRYSAPASLRRELSVPVYGGELALCVSDVTGRSFYYAVERE